MLLDFDAGTICFTIGNLLVLYLLLKRFLFKPVNAMLDSRSQAIADSIGEAEAQKAAAKRLREQYEAQLAQARADAAAIAAEAKARGEREYQARMAAAEADRERLLAETRAQLAAEREAMLSGARRQVAALALLAAAKVTRQSFGSDGERALVDAFLSEAGELE